jgi:hypothetical protein
MCKKAAFSLQLRLRPGWQQRKSMGYRTTIQRLEYHGPSSTFLIAHLPSSVRSDTPPSIAQNRLTTTLRLASLVARNGMAEPVGALERGAGGHAL